MSFPELNSVFPELKSHLGDITSIKNKYTSNFGGGSAIKIHARRQGRAEKSSDAGDEIFENRPGIVTRLGCSAPTLAGTIRPIFREMSFCVRKFFIRRDSDGESVKSVTLRMGFCNVTCKMRWLMSRTRGFQ